MFRQLTALPERELSAWFRRAAPTLADAILLAELVRDRLGERAVADPWGKPDDRRYFQRDPAHPGWVVPVALFDLDVGTPHPPEPPSEGLPPELRVPESARRRPPQIASRDRRPGTLALREGARVAQISYNADGIGFEWMRSTGDPGRDTPGYGVDDALVLHDQPAPLSLLCRADLEPDGEPRTGVADKIAALDATGDVPARVWMPVPCPGGYGGLLQRTLWRLRAMAFAGELDDPDEGWLIVDGFDQTAVGGGDTFDEAWAAFRAAVATRCPKPPPNLTEAQKAEVREALAELGRPPEAPEPGEAPTVTKKGDKLTIVPIAMTIRFVPPRILDWPAQRPEDVPAIAIPLPRRPRVPDHLQVMGFSRTMRLFGDDGRIAHGFFRADPRGITFVGERAAPFVVPGTFDADRRALDDAARAGFDAAFGTDAFARHAAYPWRVVDYHALPDDRRGAGPLRSGGIAHTAAWDGAGLTERSAWMIHVADRAP